VVLRFSASHIRYFGCIFIRCSYNALATTSICYHCIPHCCSICSSVFSAGSLFIVLWFVSRSESSIIRSSLISIQVNLNCKYGDALSILILLFSWVFYSLEKASMEVEVIFNSYVLTGLLCELTESCAEAWTVALAHITMFIFLNTRAFVRIVLDLLLSSVWATNWVKQIFGVHLFNACHTPVLIILVSSRCRIYCAHLCEFHFAGSL